MQGFDVEVLRPVLRAYEEKKLRHETEAAARTREVYAKLPRVAAIDTELKTTALSIVRASFSNKKDTRAALQAVRNHNLKLQAERAEALVAAGYTYDYTEPRYDCAQCEDTGYVGETPCECLKRAYCTAQVEELSRILCVDASTFKGFKKEWYPKTRAAGQVLSPYEQMEQVYNYCVNYVRTFGDVSDNVFFTGASGLGKTMLAACIAREVAMTGASVVYDTAFPTFARFEDEKFGRLSAGTSTRRYFSCDLLILDDLATEQTTQFTTAVLYNLINTRGREGKKTILISSLGMEEIAKRYSGQLASRLTGDFITLAFCGQDIRALKRR